MGLPPLTGTCVTLTCSGGGRLQPAPSPPGGGHHRVWPSIVCAIVLCTCASVAAAQDTHLLVITGVSGDDEHAKAFHEWAARFIEAAKKKDSVADRNITYLAEKTDIDPARIRDRSTRENVEKAVGAIAARAKANDEVVILLIGHGSFDGKVATFNLPGPDLTVAEWTKLLGKFTTQKVVFVNTSSSSGAFLPAIAGPGRTIVTATKTGGERNETRFAAFFVEAFNDEAADSDRNGHVSILEAFDYARTKVAAEYQRDGLLQTEHAVLEDGAQGKLAGMVFLAANPGTLLNVDVNDPEIGALVARHDALDKQIATLRLTKDSQAAANYEQELERLLTELAVNTRAIRDLQAKKGK
jgi:hypothetical protein